MYICPTCTKKLKATVVSPGPTCPRCTTLCKVSKLSRLGESEMTAKIRINNARIRMMHGK